MGYETGDRQDAGRSLHIDVYVESEKPTWDQFVSSSKNGTFLFLRDYMDYHKERFHDYSLMIRWSDGRVVALLPAHKVGETLVSHGGLTYGGLVTDMHMRSSLMLEVYQLMLDFLRTQGVRRLVYKAIPHIYHRQPAEEDLYALFRFGAALTRRDVLSVVRPAAWGELQRRRARSIRKAESRGVRVAPSDDYESFWRVLEWNLSKYHGTTPVHSLSEITRLQARFPDNVKLYAAYLGDELVAGTVIYETATVAHAQYIASSEVGRGCGALDMVFRELLSTVYRDKPYFDFGISTEREGRHLNVGLVGYKEGFGARAVVHDFYEQVIT